MERPGHRGRIAALTLAVLAAACGPDRGPEPDAGGLRLILEDRPEPGVFRRDGMGRRVPPGGATGLWAVVPDLPRPERALAKNLETGAEVTVALFASHGNRSEVQLSTEAADALGIGAQPAPVRLTALRSEPRLVPPRDGF